MSYPTEQTNLRISSNTAGLTAARFLEAARRLAEERGELQVLHLADGTSRRVIPKAILCELRDRLEFGPPWEVNPFRAELWRLPRGYRFACGSEAFADFANLNTCLPASPALFEPTNLAA